MRTDLLKAILWGLLWGFSGDFSEDFIEDFLVYFLEMNQNHDNSFTPSDRNPIQIQLLHQGLLINILSSEFTFLKWAAQHIGKTLLHFLHATILVFTLFEEHHKLYTHVVFTSMNIDMILQRIIGAKHSPRIQSEDFRNELINWKKK